MRNNYTNPEEATRASQFGHLTVKKYLGKATELVFLNELRKEEHRPNIGNIHFVVAENAWYFQPFTSNDRNDAFRFLEPADGIEELFDIEFKRKQD